jgi:hypothetical protein
MRFTQIVEFTTSRITDLDQYFDAWIIRTQGDRVPHRAVVTKDRDAENKYLLTVEFASHDEAMENSSSLATAEFAAFLAGICDGQLTFRSLDVLRAEDL